MTATIDAPVLYSRTGQPLIHAKDAAADSAGVAAAGVTFLNNLQRPQTRQLRAWSRSNEWIRAAIRKRRTQVSSAQFAVGPIDPEKPYSDALAAQIEQQLRFPNSRDDSFRTLIEPVIEDFHVIGWGVIEKEQNAKRVPLALYHLDASKILFNPDWTGKNPNQPRYYFRRGSQKIPMRNDQLIVMVADPATDRPEGLSTLEVLKNTIDAELSGSEWARDHMRHQAPNGLLHLGEDMSDDQVKTFKAFWDSEIAGRRSIAITGGTKNPSWTAFSQQAGKDLLQWQLYFIRKICAVFEISPQDIGVTFDINKATAESQADITHDAGLVPLLLLVEEYLNREFVWKIAPPEQNIRFTFTQLSDKDRQAAADLVKTQNGGLPYITINEARKEDGRDPIDGGDVIMVLTKTGAVPILGEGVPTPAEALQQQQELQQAATEALAQNGQEQPGDEPQQGRNNQDAPPPKGKGKAIKHGTPHYRASLADARRKARIALDAWYVAQAKIILADLSARRTITTGITVDPQQTRNYLQADIRWAVERAIARDRVATVISTGNHLPKIIRDLWIDAGTAAIQDELVKLGVDRTAALTDQGLLTLITLRAEQTALTIHLTLRKDAAGFLDRHLPPVDGDTYDDAAAIQAFSDWLDRRGETKSRQISITESQYAAAYLLHQFVRRNALEGTGHCEPVGAVCTECGDYVGAGEVPLDEALSWDLPAHPYCPHYVEASYTDPPEGPTLWIG